MNAALLLTLGALASSGVDVVEEDSGNRVFVPAFRSGAGATDDEAAALTDAVLESARRLRPDVRFVGEAELTGILDNEAQKQVAGCESDLSCLSEVADALNAPEVLAGNLARLGATWVLDLKRVDRGGVQVRAQVELKRAGPGVDVLLETIDDGVRALFPPTPEAVEDEAGPGPGPGPNAIPWITLGTGAAAAAAGTVAFLFALGNASRAREGLLREEHEQALEQGALLETTSYASWGLGGALVVGAVALMVLE